METTTSPDAAALQTRVPDLSRIPLGRLALAGGDADALLRGLSVQASAQSAPVRAFNSSI